MIKFLADENFPLPSVDRLQNAGYDIVAVIRESPGVEDEYVLDRAVEEGRVILTFDRDFSELLYHLKLPVPAGIVFFRIVPLTPVEPAEYLIRLMEEHRISLESKFTVVDVRGIRQRPLL